MIDALQLVPALPELPPRTAEGLEPLLTIDQLCKWTGYSRRTVQNYRAQSDDPLPTLGTPAGPRFLPSEVIAWMKRQYAQAVA